MTKRKFHSNILMFNNDIMHTVPLKGFSFGKYLVDMTISIPAQQVQIRFPFQEIALSIKFLWVSMSPLFMSEICSVKQVADEFFLQLVWCENYS